MAAINSGGIPDKVLFAQLKYDLEKAMTAEAEPIIQQALKDAEVAMRKRLASNLIARIDANVDMYRDQHNLMIMIRNQPKE